MSRCATSATCAVAYTLGAKETPPADAPTLPTFEDVKTDRHKFAQATKLIHQRDQPAQRQAAGAVPRSPGRGRRIPLRSPISQDDMDRIYGLPYTRRPHPKYKNEKIPAYETVKDSVTIMRGCFGGCTFCSITAHQGRIIQSRSQESVLTEIRKMAAEPSFPASSRISAAQRPTCTRCGARARSGSQV